MTTQAKQNTVRKPGIAARTIEAIWSHKASANTSKPVPGTHSHKDYYCADRATD